MSFSDQLRAIWKRDVTACFKTLWVCVWRNWVYPSSARRIETETFRTGSRSVHRYTATYGPYHFLSPHFKLLVNSSFFLPLFTHSVSTFLSVSFSFYCVSFSFLLRRGFWHYMVKAIPVTGREGPYGCETLRLPHFLDSSQMAVRLSTLRTSRPLTPGRFLVLISVRGWVDPRAIVRMEGLDQLKNTMTSSGIEPATFPFTDIIFNPCHLIRRWITSAAETRVHIYQTTRDHIPKKQQILMVTTLRILTTGIYYEIWKKESDSMFLWLQAAFQLHCVVPRLSDSGTLKYKH
jgi:hypothetical protein